MKVSKQKLVDMMISEVMKGVSTQIREIIREEFDIEAKRLRKKLLTEIRESLQVESIEEAAPKRLPQQPGKKKIETGDQMINSILEDIRTDLVEAEPDFKLVPETTVEDVSRKLVTEHRRTEQGRLYKPPAGEGYNFDPSKMDPAQVDWSDMVDALDKKNALPGDRE